MKKERGQRGPARHAKRLSQGREVVARCNGGKTMLMKAMVGSKGGKNIGNSKEIGNKGGEKTEGGETKAMNRPVRKSRLRR